MPHTLSEIRELPNYELYRLRLVHAASPVFVVAVLTQKAVDLGVRFDNDRKDYRFNLSQFLGNDDGRWTGGSGFETSAKHIGLDLNDRKNRCLVADLQVSDNKFNEKMRYNLDENLGLVDYFHPREKETYFRLGVKPRGSQKRTLALCFDGTSNHFSHQNTNVVKFFELLKKDDPERQMVYYQPGVGTYTSQAWISPITENVAKTADLAVAWYLYQHIIDGYKFLMETYRDGDRICIFGFSRGAYTARALAGMLHCVGLLPRHNVEHAPFAYQIYASQKLENKTHNTNSANNTETEANSDEASMDELNAEVIVADLEVSDTIIPNNVQLVGNPPDVPPPNNPLKRAEPEHKLYGALGSGGNSKATETDPEAYKQTFCTPVIIDFVGVWDTVGSVGAIIPQTLPFIDHNPSIRVFRHALALDEHRANFVPSLWDHANTVKGQDVREVWFRGQHTDVGGGAPPPTTTRAPNDPQFTALSNISLRWMVQQCLENKICLTFDRDAMELYRRERVLEYRPAQPDLSVYKARIQQAQTIDKKQIALNEAKAAEREHRRRLYVDSSALDKIDIKHIPYDAVAKFSLWKILELFPSTRPAQTAEGPQMTHVPNFGKTRMIYRRNAAEPVFIHASVVDFLTTGEGKGYIPSATWHGFEDGVLPPIETFEGNPVTQAESAAKTVLIAALNLNWKQAPGVWSRLKDSVGSIGGKIGGLFGLSKRD